jgi:hypothetical protein
MAVPNYQFQYSALCKPHPAPSLSFLFQHYEWTFHNSQLTDQTAAVRIDPSTPVHAAEFNHHPVYAELFAVLDSLLVKEWVEQVGGCSVTGDTVGSMTRYEAGDYTMAHTDTGTDPARRRVAYVLHMAKDWQAKDGGDLVFMNPPTFIAASYNAMTVFPVCEYTVAIILGPCNQALECLRYLLTGCL